MLQSIIPSVRPSVCLSVLPRASRLLCILDMVGLLQNTNRNPKPLAVSRTDWPAGSGRNGHEDVDEATPLHYPRCPQIMENH